MIDSTVEDMEDDITSALALQSKANLTPRIPQ